MKIALGSDHAGYLLKAAMIPFLVELGHEPVDYGCESEAKANYVLYGEKAVRGMTEGPCQRAILFCGSGLGMAIVANKFKGVRATPCWDEYTARLSRAHNDANCLTLGGRTTPADKARAIIRIWLETEFEGGRHEERLETLRAVEERICKS
jgi:ribose 5-phosphate isomerase B